MDNKWDLSKIYANDEEFVKELDIVSNDIDLLDKFKNHVLDSADNLYETLSFSSSVGRKLEKLATYAMRNNDADTSVSKYQDYVGRVQNLYQKYSLKMDYLNPELLKGDFSKYIGDSRFKDFDMYFRELERSRKHILSEKEENILSNLTLVLSSASDTFEKLNDTDMSFGKIKVDGKMVELTHSNYSTFMESSNRDVRKAAFKKMYNAYKSVNNTLASTLSGCVNANVALSRIHKYNCALEMSLDGDNLDTKLYTNLIDSVNKNMSVMYKYLDLRKDILKLDDMHLYDTYAKLVDDNIDYSFDEAKDIVINALSILGDDYINDLKKAFDQRWIDVYPKKCKRSGAYSSGSYDTYPYLLLNFEGKLNDVSTLAHELGHSMHTYYSNKNNCYEKSNYTIFVAEVASTVNELLLGYYLLNNSKSSKEKKAVINHILELYKGTLFRQTMFAEFEYNIYDMVEKGGVLTAELLNNEYYKLVKKYFGSNVIIDEDIKYEWSRIPHFYYFFYVYEYATSISAASLIASKIISGDMDMRNKYLEFLKMGGSKYPLDELRSVGIDMSDPEVVESAIKMFDKYIDEFKKIEVENGN